MSGIVGEFVALDILDEQLSDAVVRRGKKEDEYRDTDILVNWLRISVTRCGAFSEKEFEKYGGHDVAVYTGFPTGVKMLDVTVKGLSFILPKGDRHESYFGLAELEQIARGCQSRK